MNNRIIDIAIQKINDVKTNNLLFLDLSGLGLTQIPESIKEVKHILDLDLSYNQLTEFPKELIEFQNLINLNIKYNNLRDIEFEYGRNYSLKYLNLSHNCLNHIPKGIWYLPALEKNFYDNNPFLKDVPLEIIEANNLAYIDYYFDSFEENDGRARLFETKLLLVGKGNTGKTSLMNILKDDKYEVIVGEEQTTQGINIDSYITTLYFPAQYPYYNKFIDSDSLYISSTIENENEIEGEEFIHISEYYNGFDLPIDYRISNEPAIEYNPSTYFEKEIKMNVWDFGGQEILYATHQFFLTQRSIYIFLWDSRSDGEQESFDYWLNTIARLGKESPVIVVMNKLDLNVKEINEEYYKDKFTNIISFIKISCLTREGIDVLKQEIDNAISDLQHIGLQLPNSWDNIRKNIKACKKDYISLLEFKNLSNLFIDTDINYITGFLHDLGDIIYFGQDYILNDIIVLDPNWLTAAIYTLINNNSIKKSKPPSISILFFLSPSPYSIHKLSP